jgi:hypothetical protein
MATAGIMVPAFGGLGGIAEQGIHFSGWAALAGPTTFFGVHLIEGRYPLCDNHGLGILKTQTFEEGLCQEHSFVT